MATLTLMEYHTSSTSTPAPSHLGELPEQQFLLAELLPSPVRVRLLTIDSLLEHSCHTTKELAAMLIPLVQECLYQIAMTSCHNYDTVKCAVM